MLLTQTCLTYLPRIVLVTLTVTLASGLGPVRQSNAEHRVALVIDNNSHADSTLARKPRDLQSLVTALEGYGFGCEHVRNLNEQSLKKALEKFAAATPTRGTALVFYSGPVSRQDDDKTSTPGLLGTDSRLDRGVAILEVLELLSSRGGSSTNLLLLDSPDPFQLNAEIPGECLVATVDQEAFVKRLADADDLLVSLKQSGNVAGNSLPKAAQVRGKGSVAIAPPEEFQIGKSAGQEWVDPFGMVFCWCPPGKYQFGSPPDEPGRYADEEAREVTIEQGFWISKYELTYAQWRPNRPRDCVANQKNHPQDSANESKDGGRHLNALNQEASLPADWEYALPTEEQWEYAARAGTQTAHYFGADPALLPEHANFGDKSYFNSLKPYSISGHREWDDGTSQLAAVGSYAPNPWGLHDVYGNLAEWCDNSVARGGSWVSSPNACRSAYRLPLGDRDNEIYIGFRLVIRPQNH